MRSRPVSLLGLGPALDRHTTNALNLSSLQLAPALLLLGIAIVVEAKRRWDLAESPTP